MLRHVVMVMVLALAGATPALAAGASTTDLRAEAVGLNSAKLARIDSTIEAAIRDGAAPGVALAIGRHGQIVSLKGYGHLTYAADAPAITDSTLFDLASLTKVVGTTTAVEMLVDQGRLNLDTPIYQYLRMWPNTGLSSLITLRHLLTHTSGLPAGADLWTVAGREARISKIANMRLAAPPGTETIYSDLGMVVVGAVIESVTGERLDDFLEREVFARLGMNETMFNPTKRLLPIDPTLPAATPVVSQLAHPSVFFAPFALVAQWTTASDATDALFANDEAQPHMRILDRTQIAPTEYDRDRGYALQGVVHDPTAEALDGVAGNAGLFSSARDLATFANLMLEAARDSQDLPGIRAATVSEFVRSQGPGLRALGWDLPSGHSSAGEYFSEESFGHTGFTGTSIWIDPKRDVFVVLLTNRIYPTALNEKHKALRRAVHDEVELAIDDEEVSPRAAPAP